MLSANLLVNGLLTEKLFKKQFEEVLLYKAPQSMQLQID